MVAPKSKVYSLLALSQSIHNLIEQKIGSRVFWLKAEIAQIKKAASGHWYMDLVQEKNGQRLASMQAVIWSLDFEQIYTKHGPEITKLFKAGQELVLAVMVDYHSVYGLKLLVKDLDLSYVLGELERRKLATIESLKKEGLDQKNKAFTEQIIWQRIAVLSSESAAAYHDFLQHLKQNEMSYRLQTDLYPVPVQGVAAADKIIKVLRQIDLCRYDLLVIIRGGGSRLDLDSFNDELLARTVANLGIPVHTGIGHENDWTVLDLVAHKAHKTPTAAADYLLDKMQAFETALQQQAEVLQRTVQLFLKQEDQDLMQIKEQLNYIPLGQIRQERGDIHQKANTMVRATADALKIHETQLHRCTQLLAAKPSQLLEKKANKLSDLQEALSRMGVWQLERLQKNLATVHQTLDLLKPERTLERGFSITRKGHKSIRNVQDLKVGDVLETQLAKGKIESKIIRLRKDDE